MYHVQRMQSLYCKRTSLFVVVNGHVRKRKGVERTDVKQHVHVNFQQLFDKQADCSW